MLKLILMLTLVSVSGNAAADWTKIVGSESADFYIDSATVRKDGNLRRVWELRDLKARESSGELSTKAYVEYDCDEGRVRILQISNHSAAMGGGETLIYGPVPPRWDYIAPGTTQEVRQRFVCDKK